MLTMKRLSRVICYGEHFQSFPVQQYPAEAVSYPKINIVMFEKRKIPRRHEKYVDTIFPVKENPYKKEPQFISKNQTSDRLYKSDTRKISYKKRKSKENESCLTFDLEY